ncbi:Hypothetical protein PACV_3 [Pacmanvirus A23]|uniref:Hypothetical protein n=1 Tax=Pacmanvirus A23 TaxID=1932881 RepID=UPI000A092072|nr:Hypothetical protein B9W72_gp003 [Pacmanvirus A23]SIP85720.1 Hypothetical protein PACV_3 [Pacmanvirus A23]
MSETKYEKLSELNYLELYQLTKSEFTTDEIFDYIKQNRESDLKAIAAAIPLYKFDHNNILFYRYLNKIKFGKRDKPLFSDKHVPIKQNFKEVDGIEIYEPIFNPKFQKTQGAQSKYINLSQLSNNLYFVDNIFNNLELTTDDFDALLDQLDELDI